MSRTRLRRPRLLPTARIGRLSVRAFFRSRLTIAALAALTLIPILYSGLYLWSFWDPFSRMDHLPVALVNEDRPAEREDGGELAAGDALADELLDGGELDWHEADAAEAADGVREGRYYVSLTIPADFSEQLTAPERGDGTPVPALLQADYNDANGYTVRQLLSSAFAEVRAAASSSAAADYLDALFVGFGDVREATAEAADGAGELADGSSEAKDGSADLADGASSAEEGAGDLSSGVAELYAGSRDLASGAGDASGAVSDAVDGLDPVAEEWIPKLREDAPDISSGAQDIADAASAVSDALEELPEPGAADPAGAGSAAGPGSGEPVDAAGLADRIGTRLSEDPGLEQREPEAFALLTEAQTAADRAAELEGFVADHRDSIDSVAERAGEVAATAEQVADGAPDLADGAEDAMDEVHDLDDGLADLASGARDLRDGLEEASGGAGDLHDGLGDLDEGAAALDGGLADLSEGSSELAGGLSDGVGAIPDFGGSGERADRAEAMGDPVHLASATANEAPDYGTGFAPFFIALSLWVGAMMVFMVLPPVPPRSLASAAPSWRIALAGWLPAAAIGAGQVLVSLTVLHFALGLQADRWPALIGVLLLTAAAYAAVVQWANARFGASGRVVALILLMLQLTSAGGTYPIETSPGFFQAIAPYLPMSWVVSALRVLISGGDPAIPAAACGVLAAYLAVFALLTWWAVARRRTWTLADLHPPLSL